jgi:hypothetical protein
MTDPLAQYRKKLDGVAAQPPPPKGPDGYVAFDAKDRVSRLKIRRASEDDPTRSPGYHYLLDVVYSGPNVTHLVLLYTFLIVKVRGTNLLPIVMAVELGTADYISDGLSFKSHWSWFPLHCQHYSKRTWIPPGRD